MSRVKLVTPLLLLSLTGCGVFDDPLLTKCDDAIKAKLKAPSSYKRIKADGVSGSFYNIEYDAVNSFNAPLRGKGSCFSKAGGNPDWFESPTNTEQDTMTAP